MGASKVNRTQGLVPPGVTVRALRSFQKEFAGIYPDEVLRMVGVGPTETFLGLMAERGLITFTADEDQ